MSDRIISLPTRDWQDVAKREVARLSDLLRTEYGNQDLRPAQACTLFELAVLGGAFCGLRTGGGKTHIAGMAPTVLDCRRPMAFMPASAIDQFEDHLIAASDHWQIDRNIRTESYHALSQDTDKSWNLLKAYEPDLVIFDEAHKLRRIKEAMAPKRVEEYVQIRRRQRKPCHVLILTGSMSKEGILDYWHMLKWTLGRNAPVPMTLALAKEWEEALLDPEAPCGAICEALGIENLEISSTALNKAYGERLRRTPGVIILNDSFDGVKVSLQPYFVQTPEKVDALYTALRNQWLAPDGWDLADSKLEGWELARQLGLGYYHEHNPWPPKPWYDARRGYCKTCRWYIEEDPSGKYQSEQQIRRAFQKGTLKGKVWEDWSKLGPTFKVKRRVRWVSTFALDAVAEFAEKCEAPERLIIWSAHGAFARRLAKRNNWPYFGADGLDKSSGTRIDLYRGKTPIIASIKACGAAFNLQARNLGLLVGMWSDPRDMQQLLARQFRDGQKREVKFWYFATCHEHTDAIEIAIAKSLRIKQREGLDAIILNANPRYPKRQQMVGPAWQRGAQADD